MHHCLPLSSILNKQYLQHSGKEFEGSSDRLPFIKRVVHRLQCQCVTISLLLFLPVDHYGVAQIKFSDMMNVHALVTTMIL